MEFDEKRERVVNINEKTIEQKGEPAPIMEGIGDFWGGYVEMYANISGNLLWLVRNDSDVESNHRINLHYPKDSHYHIHLIFQNLNILIQMLIMEHIGLKEVGIIMRNILFLLYYLIDSTLLTIVEGRRIYIQT